jgi:DNA-binding NtrC family response regulator
MAKLLIVDDEKNIRQTVARFLESCNYQVATADSGRQALELMSKCGEFDLVLSDWRMAEMNGLELLKNIKQKFPDTVVILMTAYGTIDNAVARKNISLWLETRIVLADFKEATYTTEDFLQHDSMAELVQDSW